MKLIYQLCIFTFICYLSTQANVSAFEREASTTYNISEFERQWVEKLLPYISEWARTQEKESSLVGRKLTSEERVMAEKIGVKNIALVRVVVDKQFPMPTNQPLRDGFKRFSFNTKRFSGFTLGYVIFIKPTVNDLKTLLAHELIHVKQSEQMGLEKFLERYFIEIIKFGYDNAPLELEARAVEQMFK